MRELEIVVTADTLQARQAFKTLDADIAKVTTSTQGLGETIQQDAVKPLETLVVSEVEADKYLSQLHVEMKAMPSTFQLMRGGLNGMAEGFGITVASLGLLQSGFLAFGTAMAAFTVTKTVLEFTGLNKTIADAVGSWGGYDKQLADQVSAAHHEQLAVQAQHALNVIAQGPKILENWHREISEKAGPVMGQFIKDIESHNYSLEQLNQKYHISIPALKNFENEMREAAAEAKRSADVQIKSLREQEQAADSLEKAYLKLHLNVARGLEQMTKETEKMLASLTKGVNDAVIAELNAQTQLNKAQGLDAYGAITMQTTALGTYQKALEALHATKVEGISQSAQEQVLMDALSKSLYDDAIAQDHARDATAGHNNELARMPALANEAAGSLQGLVVSAEALRQAYASAGFITHAGISGLGSPPIQARATGGPVSAGSPYMVGERGPELFVPGSSGSILPNSGASVVNHFYINGSIQDLARPLVEEITRTLRQGRKLPAN